VKLKLGLLLELKQLLQINISQGVQIMASLDEVKAALAQERQERVAMEGRVTALLNKIIANPQIPDSVLADIKADTAALQADFVNDPTAPAPAPAPADSGSTAGETQVP